MGWPSANHDRPVPPSAPPSLASKAHALAQSMIRRPSTSLLLRPPLSSPSHAPARRSSPPANDLLEHRELSQLEHGTLLPHSYANVRSVWLLPLSIRPPRRVAPARPIAGLRSMPGQHQRPARTTVEPRSPAPKPEPHEEPALPDPVPVNAPVVVVAAAAAAVAARPPPQIAKPDPPPPPQKKRLPSLYSVAEWEGQTPSLDFSFLQPPAASPGGAAPSTPAVRELWLTKLPKREPRQGHQSYVQSVQDQLALLRAEGVVARRGFVSQSLDLKLFGLAARPKPKGTRAGTPVRKGPPPPPAAASNQSASAATSPLPAGFFTSNARSPLSVRREPSQKASAVEPPQKALAVEPARMTPMPPPPKVHDFHKEPFDPHQTPPHLLSSFAPPAEPATSPASRRASRTYVVVESLRPVPAPPPSTLFQSASRPLSVVNPSATRTRASEIGITAASVAPRQSAPKSSLTVLEGTADETWAQYVSSTPAGFPTSLLSALYDSQSTHADDAVRRARLVNVALRATAVDGDPLSVAQLTSAFEAGLETAEAHELAHDDGQTARAQKLCAREDMAVALREIWRATTDLLDQGSSSLTWDESQALLWRWVGLLVWSGPLKARDAVLGSYARPSQRADRVDDLALFLDKAGSPAEAHLDGFCQTICRGWVNAELSKELRQAKQHVIDIRADRDAVLVGGKKPSGRAARRSLWTFLQDAYGGRAGTDTTAVEGWVETLLVAPKPSSDAPPPSPTTPALSPSEAASLSSRWSSAMLLVRSLGQSNRPLPKSALWHLCDGLRRLKSSADHRVPLEHLRSLVSAVLQSSPDLSVLAPRQHYDLLLEFIENEDLPFAKRLYQAFRLRERSFAFAEDVTVSLLRLAVGLRRGERVWTEGAPLKDSVFAGALYDDRMAWGCRALEGDLLHEIVYVIGREPRLGGLASRILSDSIVSHGPDVMTDDVARSIAKSARDRVVKAATRAGDPNQRPSSADQILAAGSAFCVLPLLRGCYHELGRPPPVTIFNDLLALAAEHPTPYNRQAAVAEFTAMVNHGPLPNTVTFDILMGMHLGVRPNVHGIADIFHKTEPCAPHLNLVRAITLFKTMVVRQRLQPSPQTFTYFLHGLLASDQPAAAFECFRHAVHLDLVPSHDGVLQLVRALVDGGLLAQASSVVESLAAAPNGQRHVQMDEARLKALSDVVLATVVPTRTLPSQAQSDTPLSPPPECASPSAGPAPLPSLA